MAQTTQLKEPTMYRTLALCAAVLFAVNLTACNTVRGIGQDVKKAGEVIEGAGKK